MARLPAIFVLRMWDDSQEMVSDNECIDSTTIYDIQTDRYFIHMTKREYRFICYKYIYIHKYICKYIQDG